MENLPKTGPMFAKKEDILEAIEIPEYSTANSFTELFDIIEQSGEEIGSQKVYSAEELIDTIKKVQNGEMGLEYVTSTNGLRNAVEKLLEKEEASLPVAEAIVEDSLEQKPLFSSCISFGEIFEKLKEKGVINGSSKTYYWEELRDIIQDVQDGKLELSYVTNAEGLRDAVARILENRVSDIKQEDLNLEDNNFNDFADNVGMPFIADEIIDDISSDDNLIL